MASPKQEMKDLTKGTESWTTDNNCEKCLAQYAPYKTGKDEDCATDWCQIPILNVLDKDMGYVKEPKGVCQFCNPKSKLFNK